MIPDVLPTRKAEPCKIVSEGAAERRRQRYLSSSDLDGGDDSTAEGSGDESDDSAGQDAVHDDEVCVDLEKMSKQD